MVSKSKPQFEPQFLRQLSKRAAEARAREAAKFIAFCLSPGPVTGWDVKPTSFPAMLKRPGLRHFPEVFE